MRKGMDVILNRLRRLPQAKAQMCNSGAPLIAFKVLDDEVNSIIEAARLEYLAILNAKKGDEATTPDQSEGKKATA